MNSLQVCAALRKMSSVLRLGVYRERIEKYGGSAKSNSNGHAANGNGGVKCEELLTVTVERQVGVTPIIPFVKEIFYKDFC